MRDTELKKLVGRSANNDTCRTFGGTVLLDECCIADNGAVKYAKRHKRPVLRWRGRHKW